MSSFYWTGQRRPTAYQALERSHNRSFPNHYRGFVRDDDRPSSGYHSQHMHPTQRRDAVAYDHALHGQHDQAYYPQKSSARPTDSQRGSHMDRHNFDYQQYNPRHIGDSKTSSTAAMAGSHVQQPSFASPQPYHDFHTTAQAGDRHIEPARMPYQQQPLVNHSALHGGTTRPAMGQCSEPSYQHDGQIEHFMNPHAPLMSNSRPTPALYQRSQVRSSHPQPTYVPPPAMQTPSFAPMPPTYIQNVPVQPPNVNALYPAGHRSYPQPPQTDQPSLSTTAVDQHQNPRVNNDNAVDPASIAPGATRLPKKSRRGNGRGNGQRRAKGSSKM